MSHPSDELLSGHLDGALEAPEDAELRVHLAGCPDCSRRLALLAATRQAVSELPPEAPPRPLDLAFLGGGAPREVARKEEFARWRPPAWVAPVLAAAAMVVVAVGVAPRLRGQPAGSSEVTAGVGASRAGNQAAGSAAAPLAGGNSPGLTDRGLEAGAAPTFGKSLAPLAVARSTPGPGGLVVTVDAPSAAVARGQATGLTVTAGGSASATQVKVLQLTVAAAGGSDTLASAASFMIPGGQTSVLTSPWTAGVLGGRSPVPGDYRVDATLTLFDGRELVATLVVRVT